MGKFRVVLGLGLVFAVQPAPAQDAPGKALVFDQKKGNCLACHAIPVDPVGQAGGNIAPPFVGMAARFPDRARLRSQVYDATVANPDSMMPPFGRNGILTDAELDAVVGYLLTL